MVVYVMYFDGSDIDEIEMGGGGGVVNDCDFIRTPNVSDDEN